MVKEQKSISTIRTRINTGENTNIANDDKCNKVIKCYDFVPRKCQRPKGHTLGCNPFSDTYVDPREHENE